MTTLNLPPGISDLPTYLATLGIDSLKRAVTFAAMCLRRSNNDTLNEFIGVNSPFYNSVQFAFVPPSGNSQVGQLMIAATMWYEILTALEDCFGLAQNLFSYSSYAISTGLTDLPASNLAPDDYQNPTRLFYQDLPLPTIPDSIDNTKIEQFFYWSLTQYQIALFNLLNIGKTVSGVDSGINLPTGETGAYTATVSFPESHYPIADSITITPYDNTGSIVIAITFAFNWYTWLQESTVLAAF